MIIILLASGFSGTAAGLISPLFFGVAHLHHAYNFIFYDRVPVLKAFLQVGFQFLYTTIFGWYGSWMFLRSNTGNFYQILSFY
jgi:prenyl protein peptidase